MNREDWLNYSYWKSNSEAMEPWFQYPYWHDRPVDAAVWHAKGFDPKTAKEMRALWGDNPPEGMGAWVKIWGIHKELGAEWHKVEYWRDKPEEALAWSKFWGKSAAVAADWHGKEYWRNRPGEAFTWNREPVWRRAPEDVLAAWHKYWGEDAEKAAVWANLTGWWPYPEEAKAWSIYWYGHSEMALEWRACWGKRPADSARWARNEYWRKLGPEESLKWEKYFKTNSFRAESWHKHAFWRNQPALAGYWQKSWEGASDAAAGWCRYKVWESCPEDAKEWSKKWKSPSEAARWYKEFGNFPEAAMEWQGKAGFGDPKIAGEWHEYWASNVRDAMRWSGLPYWKDKPKLARYYYQQKMSPREAEERHRENPNPGSLQNGYDEWRDWDR